MNEERNIEIGSPCPLGPFSGIWSLTLKIVLIIILISIPIIVISTITLLHNLYIIKTEDHQKLLSEYKTHHHLIVHELENINNKIENLPIKEWQKQTGNLNSKDHADIEAKLDKIIQHCSTKK